MTLVNIHRQLERAFFNGCYGPAAMLITLIEVVNETMNSSLFLIVYEY